MCKHCPGVDDCAHDRAEDVWLTPADLKRPAGPDVVHQPQMGRAGGELDRCGRGSCCLLDGHGGRCER